MPSLCRARVEQPRMNRRSTLQALSGCLCLGTRAAQAHKLHYSLTELFWRPDSASLEVVHSIHLDDALALLARLGDPNGELPVSTQARLLLYTEQNFQLTLNEQALALDPVGAQIDGDYLWIYQEYPMSDYPAGLQVECTLMHGFSPSQQNQVNLRVGDDVRTLNFHAGLRRAAF